MSQLQQVVHSVDQLAKPRRRRARLPSPVAGAQTHPIRVYLFAKDAILRDGIATQFRASPSVTVHEATFDPGGVAVIVADELQDDAINAIAGIHRSCTSRIVVVTAKMTPASVSAALRAGAWCFVRRPEARTDRLLAAVSWAAKADASATGRPLGAPPATCAPTTGAPPTAAPATAMPHTGIPGTGMLATSGGPPVSSPAGQAHPAQGLDTSWWANLSTRDVDVLRLVAEGWSTASIAVDLAYSESTIKNVIHDIVNRLDARNRAHAVAMAIRAGII